MKTAKSVSNVFEGVTDGAGIVLTNLSQGAVEFAQHKSIFYFFLKKKKENQTK